MLRLVPSLPLVAGRVYCPWVETDLRVRVPVPAFGLVLLSRLTDVPVSLVRAVDSVVPRLISVRVRFWSVVLLPPLSAPETERDLLLSVAPSTVVTVRD